MKKPKWPRKAGKMFKIPLFGQEMWAFYDRASYEQALQSVGCEPPDNLLRYGGLMMELETDEHAIVYLVGIFEPKISIVVHESVHVVQYAMRDVGSEDDETAAYLTEAVFEHIFSNPPKEKQVEPT